MSEVRPSLKLWILSPLASQQQEQRFSLRWCCLRLIAFFRGERNVKRRVVNLWREYSTRLTLLLGPLPAKRL